jgi:hypothetical protein
LRFSAKRNVALTGETQQYAKQVYPGQAATDDRTAASREPAGPGCQWALWPMGAATFAPDRARPTPACPAWNFAYIAPVQPAVHGPRVNLSLGRAAQIQRLPTPPRVPCVPRHIKPDHTRATIATGVYARGLGSKVFSRKVSLSIEHPLIRTPRCAGTDGLLVIRKLPREQTGASLNQTGVSRQCQSHVIGAVSDDVNWGKRR